MYIYIHRYTYVYMYIYIHICIYMGDSKHGLQKVGGFGVPLGVSPETHCIGACVQFDSIVLDPGLT